MRRLETTIENKAVSILQGWAIEHNIDMRIVKISALGNRGWPDRLILWSGENCLFVEFKRPGEKPRKMQTLIHEILRRMGFEVQVHDDTYVAVEKIKAFICSTLVPNTGNEDDGEQGRGEDLP